MSDNDYSYGNDSYDDHSYDFDDYDYQSSYDNEDHDYGDDTSQYHDYEDHEEDDDATAYSVQSFGGFVYHSRTSDYWKLDDSDEVYHDTPQSAKPTAVKRISKLPITHPSLMP